MSVESGLEIEKRVQFSLLFCLYQINVFGKEFRTERSLLGEPCGVKNIFEKPFMLALELIIFGVLHYFSIFGALWLCV